MKPRSAVQLLNGPWKPYDRFHLRRRFARMGRRPFTPVWMSNYAISRALRDTRNRRKLACWNASPDQEMPE